MLNLIRIVYDDDDMLGSFNADGSQGFIELLFNERKWKTFLCSSNIQDFTTST